MEINFKEGDRVVIPFQVEDLEELLPKLGFGVDEDGFVIDRGGGRIKSFSDEYIKIDNIIMIAPGSEPNFIVSDEDYNIYLFEKMDS